MLYHIRLYYSKEYNADALKMARLKCALNILWVAHVYIYKSA